MPHAGDHIPLTSAEAETLRALCDESMTNPQLAEHFGVKPTAWGLGNRGVIITPTLRSKTLAPT